MRPLLRSACLLALMLASGSAAALGLGQIQVKSGIGEPLLAEIPVISSDPEELRQLQASLASPATFTRIGLEPPIGVVAGLQFTPTVDASGRPIIRVTSSQPVTQAMLTFLIEVDWGQGRLVREYSALVDTPQSVAAQPVQPVQAPVVESPPVIQRPQAPRPAAAAAQQAPRPTPEARPAPAPVASRPTAPSAPAADADRYAVRRGDTLSRIANRVSPEGITSEQTMVGLLRANPQAFIGGDMNQLRSGSVLRVPRADELDEVEAREAAALVQQYARQWRQARTQPVQATNATDVAQAPPAESPQAPRPAAPGAGGRLEIVPPGTGAAARAGTQSGIAAGGEGEMLRQELQQTKESLAARDAELQELKSRVAELEQLQKDQQKLISMKDAELNAAQQRAEASEPAGNVASSPLPWITVLAFFVVAIMAAAWNHRRARRNPVFRAPAEGSRPSIADAFAPVAPDSDADAAADAVPAHDAVGHPSSHDAPREVDAVPSWERRLAGRHAQPDAHLATAVAAPAWAADVDDGEAGVAPQVDSTDAERLELAQAYIDLGDTAKARALLSDVAGSDDATARDVATRMLQGLG